MPSNNRYNRVLDYIGKRREMRVEIKLTELKITVRHTINYII